MSEAETSGRFKRVEYLAFGLLTLAIFIQQSRWLTYCAALGFLTIWLLQILRPFNEDKLSDSTIQDGLSIKNSWSEMGYRVLRRLRPPGFVVLGFLTCCQLIHGKFAEYFLLLALFSLVSKVVISIHEEKIAERARPRVSAIQCGQCGIDFRPGAKRCHFCHWQPPLDLSANAFLLDSCEVGKETTQRQA